MFRHLPVPQHATTTSHYSLRSHSQLFVSHTSSFSHSTCCSLRLIHDHITSRSQFTVTNHIKATFSRSVSFHETARRKNFSSLVISVIPSISVLELCFGHFSLRKFAVKFSKFQCNYFSSFCEPSLFFGLFKNPVAQVFDKESKCLSTGTYYKVN